MGGWSDYDADASDIVEAAFPDLPFTWVDSASADGKVFMLYRDDLAGG